MKTYLIVNIRGERERCEYPSALQAYTEVSRMNNEIRKRGFGRIVWKVVECINGERVDGNRRLSK